LRKLIAFALLALFGLPLITPLLALSATSEANLPACCRRNGKHHCAMSMAEQSRMADSGPRFQAPPERCPYCPAQIVSASHNNIFAPRIAQAIFAGIVSHAAVIPQVESWHRISRERSRHKRGPPSSIFL
jgi:hypothetical protein